MKYTAEQIHRMRRLTDEIWGMSNERSYFPVDRERSVEGMLVTYMSNETTPEELVQEVRRLERERHERYARLQWS